jgi:two-component system, LytTR family, sensor kinase
MKKIVILLLISFSSFSQNKDSVFTLLQKYNKIDTNRINLLEGYVDVEPDPSIWSKYNLELKNILLKIINETKLQQKPKDWYVKKLVTCLLYEGQNYYQVSANFDAAMNCFLQMIKYSELINYKKGFGLAYNDIGVLKMLQKDFKEALIYHEKNAKICKENIDEQDLAIALNNIGYCYYSLKEFPKALKYYDQVLEIKKRSKDPSIVVTYSNIGNIYLQNNEYDKAYSYYTNSLNLLKKNGRRVFDQYDNMMAIHLNSISKTLLGQKKYSEALKIAKEAIVMANQAKRLRSKELATETLSKSYAANNQYKLALDSYREYIVLRDSTANKENNEKILKAEFKYETELKETQIKSLAQQKQISELESTRKTTLIYSILGGILALSAIAYFSFTRFRTKKENELLSNQLQEAERRIEIEEKATESELKALKSQMNPHFMFNALNGIQEQFMYGDKTVANEQMGNFTYLTRQILTVSGKKKINLSTEIEILTKYLELEKMRFAEGFNYAINLSKNIDEDYHQIPPMLIQPFVENSIKHGLLHKQGDKKVSVYFDLDEKEENLICVVEDNGVGREKSAEIKSKQIQQHESFSTSATEERLKLLGNNLNGKDLVVYEDLKNEHQEVIGTRVLITIALG